MQIKFNVVGCSNSLGFCEFWDLYPTRVMKQLDGALWMYLNIYGSQIIWEIRNLLVQGGGFVMFLISSLLF